MTIEVNRTFCEIQEEFCEMFPYLKIEFFSKMQTSADVNSLKIINNRNRTLAEYSILNKKGSIIITPQMTVSFLDQCFNNEYGLSVKIFRNSWRVWLEATVTDGWTLEEQNRQGEALSGNEIQNGF